MRKVYLTLMASLFSCSAAFAFWPEASESYVEVGVGYRQDSLKWETKANTNAFGVPVVGKDKHHWKDLQIWQIDAKFKYVTCDNLYFRGSIDYGWITSGKFRETVEVTSGSSSSSSSSSVIADEGLTFHSHHKAKRGHVYDATLALGYQFRFCDESLALTPVVGYTWNGQHLNNKRGHDSSSFSSSSISSDDLTFDSFRKDYRARWNSWLVGVDFDYQICCDWSLFAAYEYHWGHYHAKGGFSSGLDSSSSSSSSSSSFDSGPLGSFNHHAKRAHGNLFNIGVKWDFCECWTASLTGQFQWWNTKRGRESFKFAEGRQGDVRETCYIKFPLEHVRWETGSITLDVGMVF